MPAALAHSSEDDPSSSEASHSAKARWASSISASLALGWARSAQSGSARRSSSSSQSARSSAATGARQVRSLGQERRLVTSPLRPPARRGPRRRARSSARTLRRNSPWLVPPEASGCFSVASRWIGSPSPTTQCAVSRRKLPGGDWSSGMPALSSARTSQRCSSTATRRARLRSEVTSATRLPGVSRAARTRRASWTASLARSGAVTISSPWSALDGGWARRCQPSLVAAGRITSASRCARSGELPGTPSCGQHSTAARSIPTRSRSRFRQCCGWSAPTWPQSSSSPSQSRPGRTMQPCGRRATTPRSSATLGMLPVMPAAMTGCCGGSCRQRAAQAASRRFGARPGR